jgi:hypothetical protein
MPAFRHGENLKRSQEDLDTFDPSMDAALDKLWVADGKVVRGTE